MEILVDYRFARYSLDYGQIASSSKKLKTFLTLVLIVTFKDLQKAIQSQAEQIDTNINLQAKLQAYLSGYLIKSSTDLKTSELRATAAFGMSLAYRRKTAMICLCYPINEHYTIRFRTISMSG